MHFKGIKADMHFEVCMKSRMLEQCHYSHGENQLYFGCGLHLTNICEEMCSVLFINFCILSTLMLSSECTGIDPFENSKLFLVKWRNLKIGNINSEMNQFKTKDYENK